MQCYFYLLPDDVISAYLFLGELGKAPAAVVDSLPVSEPEGAAARAASDDEDEEVETMQARLEALRS